jgi:hypothetical protein
MNYKEIFEQADKAAQVLTLAEVGNDVMIFPCGFAWFYLDNMKGKRNPLGKELEKLGLLEYSDYHKRYYHWEGKYNQSMYHKEAHCKYMAQILEEKLGVSFGYDSRMD